MEDILQGVLDLSGVSAAIVFDAAGKLVDCRGRAIYDRALCEHVSGTLAKAVDTVRLQQEAWESISAYFADGKLLLQNLGEPTARGHVLAVVADSSLNTSFATVAIRVATNKLRKAIAEGTLSQGTADPQRTGPSNPGSSQLAAAGMASSAAGSQPLPSDSKVLANTGVSWSKSSSVGLSRVAAANPASSAFLARCAKQLARHVGPIAKVYVEESVRRVSPEAPFSLSAAAPLVNDLAAQIEDPADRAQFCKALEKP